MLGKLLLASLTTFTIAITPLMDDVDSEIIEDTPISEVIEDVYPCSIEFKIGKGGNVLTSIEEGEIGDICVVYVSPYFLYSIDSVIINGEEIELDYENKCEFALVEGVNTIQTSYVVNNEELETWAKLFADAKDNGIKAIFTKDNLLLVLSWVITSIISSGVLLYLFKTKKLKVDGAKEISEGVKKVSESTIAKAINDYMEKTFGATFNVIVNKLDGMDEVCKTLARCFVLAQEDTPEARLAIISELTKLQSSEEELTRQVRAIIEKEVEKNNKIIADQKKALQELKDSNDAIATTKVEPIIEESDNDYGQI